MPPQTWPGPGKYRKMRPAIPEPHLLLDLHHPSHLFVLCQLDVLRMRPLFGPVPEHSVWLERDGAGLSVDLEELAQPTLHPIGWRDHSQGKFVGNALLLLPLLEVANALEHLHVVRLLVQIALAHRRLAVAAATAPLGEQRQPPLSHAEVRRPQMTFVERVDRLVAIAAARRAQWREAPRRLAELPLLVLDGRQLRRPVDALQRHGQWHSAALLFEQHGDRHGAAHAEVLHAVIADAKMALRCPLHADALDPSLEGVVRLQAQGGIHGAVRQPAVACGRDEPLDSQEQAARQRVIDGLALGCQEIRTRLSSTDVQASRLCARRGLRNLEQISR
mmetsp:Transcript_92138/g.282009  ORF Transcript_92138/g.282009 Transcript_92138/m.282009 type:complete len:333 (-) Transcript_92138:489-1487(-)